MNAVLIIDKPAGLTSHDVVNRVRRILQEKSVGHLGTLDPLATGVLPLVVGNLTRLAQFYTASEKTYEGTIRFGFATDTYDSDGEPTSPAQPITLSLEQVRELAGRFRGIIEQTPPPFSAKKIQGIPAYKLARKHAAVVLKPVQVEIKEFEITRLDAHVEVGAPVRVAEERSPGSVASFRARVASGTYMRSVAHDMGKLMGCGAHLESLRRTSVGEFALPDAHTLEELDAVSGRVNRRTLYSPRKILPQFPA
jgi:tRNA pseudouridine55 synthase